MKILLLNPNTTSEVTDLLYAAGIRAASAGSSEANERRDPLGPREVCEASIRLRPKRSAGRLSIRPDNAHYDADCLKLLHLVDFGALFPDRCHRVSARGLPRRK